jgi:hypothetical protein
MRLLILRPLEADEEVGVETNAQTSHSIEIHVDPEIANAVAHLLRSHTSGVPALDAYLRTLADLLAHSDAETTATDIAIRKKVLDKIASEIGRLKGLVRVGVHNKFVELWGVVTDQRQHRALREIVGRFAEVSGVHDHLIWIDPATGAFLEAAHESAASNPPARVFED